MKKDKYRYDHLWIWVVFILLLGVLLMVGCASSKVKSSYHEKLDSSATQREHKDSVSHHDSTKLVKAHSTIIVHLDTTTTKEETTLHQIREVTKYDTLGKVREYHKTTTDLTKKKNQSTGGKSFIEDHSKIDSSAYKNRDSVSHVKSARVDLHKDQRQSSKEKKTPVFNLLWLLWLLLIPVGAWIWKNRGKIYQRIKMIVVKLLTGL
jgi:hypothetical protein